MNTLLRLGLILALVMLPAASIPAVANYEFDCSSVSEIPQLECEALVALYNSTNGPEWTDSTNWLVTNMPSDWYGVNVEYGHIIGLSMGSNQMSGSIPPELGNLKNLQYLNMDSNQLSGSIPLEMGNLSSLQYIYLSSNQLSGSIPLELGNLSNLVYLYLSSNQLSGYVPPQLGNLISLDWLSLDNNQLSGPIPPELGNLSNLGGLSLYSNQLSGPIPPQLGNLSSMVSLYLSKNQLSGSIPPQLGNLSSLLFLDLHSNQLIGSIPPELGDPSILSHLYLYDNQLGGSIPPELGDLGSLWDLNLSFNQLSGSIPLELGNLSSLRFLSLNGNQLTGLIPPELGSLTNLYLLRLNQNQLAGDVPASFVNLVNLYNPGTFWEGGDGLDLDYNALNIPNDYPNLLDQFHVFLNQKDPDWHTLQSFEQVIDSVGGTITSLDDNVEFIVPVDTLDGETTFTFTPLPDPTNETGSLVFANDSFQLSAEDALGDPVTIFDPPLNVTINYTDEDILGILEDTLRLYYWDVATSAWLDAVTTCLDGEYTRDLEGNSFSLPICHLTEFAVLGSPIHILLPLVQVNR